MTDVWESTALVEEVWESSTTPGVTWTVVVREGENTGGGAVDSVNGETGVVVLSVDDVDGRDIYNPAIIMSPAFVTASGGSMVNGVSVTIAAFAALIPVGYDILIWNGTDGGAPNGSYTHAGSGVFNYSDRQYLNLASVAAGCVKVVGSDQATSGAAGALSEWAISTANGTDFGLYPIGGYAHLVSSGLTLDASGFNGNLATTDNTLQEVAQKVDDLSLGGTVDVVSNVTGPAILGKVTGTGDSEELTAAQTRSLIGVGLHVVADRTIASGGSASESFDVTGLTIVQILFAGASERGSTLAGLYLTFNGDTSSVYSTDAGALSANLVLANVPGNNTNTDRYGFVRTDLHLLDGFYKSGVSSATSFGSTAAVGASVAHRGLFCTITGPVTSLKLSTQLGDITAGSRIIVLGA